MNVKCLSKAGEITYKVLGMLMDMDIDGTDILQYIQCNALIFQCSYFENMRSQRGLATCLRACSQETQRRVKSLDIQPVLMNHSDCLTSGSLTTDCKARIQVQVVYLGSNFRGHWLGSGK